MTWKNGRHGTKWNRANRDPRGSWASGVPASAGFYPQRGIRFAGNPDPLCAPHAPCTSDEEAGGRTFSSVVSHGMSLSRHGAPKTRLKHGMMKRRYSGTSRRKRGRGFGKKR